MSGKRKAESGKQGRDLPSSETEEEADACYVDEAEATAEGFVTLDEVPRKVKCKGVKSTGTLNVPAPQVGGYVRANGR